MQHHGQLLRTATDGRPLAAVRGQLPVLGTTGIGERGWNGAVGQPEVQLDAVVAHGLGEDAADLLRFRPPGAHVAEEALGPAQPVEAVAVEPAVDDPLYAGPQRPERHRDGERGGGGRPARARAHRDARDQHDRDVHGGEQSGEHGVDGRPADQDVDLVEPVAQDGDGDRRDDGYLGDRRREECGLGDGAGELGYSTRHVTNTTGTSTAASANQRSWARARPLDRR